MKERNSLIENQYHLPELFEKIISRLKDQGIGPENISRSDIAGVDEFHVRGAAVSKELVSEINLNNLTVLDVGCGIGGPCRMLADEFNCKVHGIDMSNEFIRTAQELSKVVDINGSTEFVQGDALDLPYQDGFFDVVWTQHVQMNIEDKSTFYSEISRVLKDNGTFLYYDIFKVKDNDVTYPVPWANDESVSFLENIENTEDILTQLGFTKSSTIDQTKQAIEFLSNLFENLKVHGPPNIGLNVLMGASTKEKLSNILSGLEGNKIELQSGIYSK